MRKLAVISAVTLVAILVVAQPKPKHNMGSTPVVIELFTSQG